jgi:hypothetical protein
MGDEGPKDAGHVPAKLGIAGRLLERILGPMLEAPGKRARDYSRADTSARAVLALCAALAGFGYLVRWQAASSAEAERDQRKAYEQLVREMLTSLKETSAQQHADSIRALEHMSSALEANTATMRAAVLEKGRR